MKARIKMINFISGVLKSLKPIISAWSSLLQDSCYRRANGQKGMVRLGPLTPFPVTQVSHQIYLCKLVLAINFTPPNQLC